MCSLCFVFFVLLKVVDDNPETDSSGQAVLMIEKLKAKMELVTSSIDEADHLMVQPRKQIRKNRIKSLLQNSVESYNTLTSLVKEGKSTLALKKKIKRNDSDA